MFPAQSEFTIAEVYMPPILVATVLGLLAATMTSRCQKVAAGDLLRDAGRLRMWRRSC
jgi:hypothetical protein